MTEPPVIVAGAGIGGLTAGVALQKRGIPVEILEQADEVRADGYGITVQVNAMLVMRALGLAESLRERGRTLTRAAIRSEQGRLLQKLPIQQAYKELGMHGLTIHRSHLLEVLREAFDGPIHLGVRVDGCEQHGDRVEVSLEGGGVREGRALIGCDGIYSTVREALHGDQPFRFAGQTTWRGLVEWDELDELTEFWGPGRRFGLAPLGDGDLYWYAVADAGEGETDGPNPTDELLEAYDDWVDPIPAVLRASDDDGVYRTDIYDRPPVADWGDGRITLLGDAAHPMAPNLGQGACQAIEDGYALASELANHDEMEAGLRAYEGRRRERAAWFVRQSRRIGEVAHWENAVARWMRDQLARWTPERVTNNQVDRMYRPDLGIAGRPL